MLQPQAAVFTNGGGGGGGGCMLLEYTTSSSILDVASIATYGGTASASGQYGGGGQVLIKQDGTNGDLFVENNGTKGADSTQAISSLTVDFIALSSEANYVVSNGKSLTVSDASPFGGDETGTLEVAGTFTYNTGNSYDNLDVSIVSGGQINNTSTINITNDGGLILGSGATANTPITTITTAGSLGLDSGATFSLTDLTITGGTTTLNSYTTATALSIDDLVMTGGILTHGDNFDSQTHILNIVASSLNIGISASASVDGVGYDGGTTSHRDGYGLGPGILGSGNSGSGGAHGGNGGNDDEGDAGGTAYCDITDPDTMGSGGGRTTYAGSNYNTGNGGGLIIFDVSGTATIDGTITADGSNAAASGYSGGGAGGGVKISADTIAGTPASFTVTGGNTSNGGGGGGGGCVLLEYIISNSINSGNVTRTGGTTSGGGVNGSDGLFSSSQLSPSAPDILYSHSTDASTGDINPTNITDLTPVFSAICNTPSGNCITADIEVDDNSDFSSTLWSSNVDIVDIADGVRSGNITYDGSQLSYNTTYYWRIRFSNAYGAGIWSSTESTFYAPRAIELYNFDQGGTVGQGQQVPILWGSSGGESNETVNIYYSTDDFGSSTEVTSSVISTSAPTEIKSYVWTIPNISSTTVKLRVCSNNDGSNTCYTSENNFTIQTDPGYLPISRNFYSDDLYTVDDDITYSAGDAQFSYSSDWYDIDWASRKKITFTNNSSLLPATQTNFPVLISLSSDSDLAADAQSNGEDILFASMADVKLDHEIEYFDGATGELVAWVNIPSLALGTEIYMYYGNNTIGSQENVSGTWSGDGNFETVWHMNETSGNIDDSANSNTATPTSVTQDVSGPTWLDGADTFNGSSSFYSVTSGANTDFTTESFSISAWIYSDSDDAGVIFDNRYDIPGTDSGWMFGLSGDTNNRTIVFDINGDNDDDTTETSPGAYTTGEWQLLSVVKDGNNGYFYRNGSLLQTISLGSSGTIIYDSNTWHNIGKIGGAYYNHNYDIPNRYFDGSIDELRVSSTNRDANWIKAAYSNQSDPSTFYTLDDETNIPSSIDQKIVFDASHSFYSVYNFNATSSGTGEVRYQISDDGGTTWNYCVGDTLTSAADDYAQTNTAIGITNTCLANLSLGGDFNVRAYLHADEGETAILSNMSFIIATSYNAINSVAEKTDGTGAVDISLELDDLNTSGILSAKLEYKAGADCSAGTSDPTIDTTVGTYSADSGTPTINNSNEYQVGSVSVVDVGTNTVDFDWLSATDEPAADGTYCVRTTAHNGLTPSVSADTTLTLDNVDPTTSGNLMIDSITANSIIYTLGAAGSDTNLDHYSIYYKQGASGVTETDTLHTTIATGAYTPGGTTTTNPLNVNTQYVANIWTYDSYGNKANATEIVTYTAANTPGALVVSNPTTSTLDVAFDVNSNPSNTEFAIQETGSGNYVQADGSLGATAIWQDNATWSTVTVTGLSLNTSYDFQTKARNGDDVETAFGGTDSLYTLAEVPGQPNISNVTNNSLDVTLGSDSNPAYTTYAIRISDGTNDYYVQADGFLGASEVWQTKAAWGTTTVTGLSAETSYTARAKARNEDGIETAFDGTDSGTTDADPDVTTPTISHQSPADGATNVGIDTNIYFELDDIYTGINISTLNVLIEGSPAINNGSCESNYSCTITSDGTGGYNVTLNPDNDFDYLQEVNVFILASDGTNSATSAWSFTTKEGGAIGDITPPTITDLSPEKGAIKISPNTTISFHAKDSESGVDIGTLRTTVTGSSSGIHKNITKAFDGSASDFKVTLIPERDFEVNEQVTLEIRIRDYAQNQTILSDYIFLITPAEEPTVDSLTEEGVTEIWRAQTTKTEEDIRLEEEQGIIDDGANIEVADLTYDGTKEIVTAPRSGAPYVRIYSKEGFILTPPFLAYDKSYTNGVNIAVGDLQGTGGEQEIVTSPMDGAAHIRIFNKDGKVLNSFFAREDSFRGNSIVKIANLEGPDQDSGDLEIIILFSDGILKVFNRDGKEIMSPITAFLPYLQNYQSVKDILFDLDVVDLENNNGAKEVLVSDHNTIMIYGKDPETKKLKQIIPDIIPFDKNSTDYNQGIVLSVADLDGTGGEKEIVVGSKKGSSVVRIFNKNGKKLRPDFYAYDPTYHGGIDLEATDLDSTSGPAEIITVAQMYSAHVRIFNKEGQPITAGFMAYPEHTDGKTKVQAFNFHNDELQGGSKEKDMIITPIQGPTHARFYSKDSELLNEGFYIVGVGTKVEVEE